MANIKNRDMKKLKVETLADLKKEVVTRLTASAAELDVKALTGEIVRDLNAAKREVVMKLLGLDNRWGKWEIDHCNGRTSPAIQHIAADSEPIIAQWFNDAVKEVLTAEMEKKFRNDMLLAIKKEVEDVVRNKVRDHARTLAETMMREAVAQVKAETLAS